MLCNGLELTLLSYEEGYEKYTNETPQIVNTADWNTLILNRKGSNTIIGVLQKIIKASHQLEKELSVKLSGEQKFYIE